MCLLLAAAAAVAAVAAVACLLACPFCFCYCSFVTVTLPLVQHSLGLFGFFLRFSVCVYVLLLFVNRMRFDLCVCIVHFVHEHIRSVNRGVYVRCYRAASGGWNAQTGLCKRERTHSRSFSLYHTHIWDDANKRIHTRTDTLTRSARQNVLYAPHIHLNPSNTANTTCVREICVFVQFRRSK